MQIRLSSFPPANVQNIIRMSVPPLQRSPWLKQLPEKVQLSLFTRCGRSWKRVLAYIAAVGSATNTDNRFSVGQVSSGQYHNVAVTAKGTVHTFGGTEEGCLGRGAWGAGVIGRENLPRPVPGLRRIRVTQVSRFHWRTFHNCLIRYSTYEVEFVGVHSLSFLRGDAGLMNNVK